MSKIVDFLPNRHNDTIREDSFDRKHIRLMEQINDVFPLSRRIMANNYEIFD